MAGIQIARPKAATEHQILTRSTPHDTTMVDIIEGGQIILKNLKMALIRVEHGGPIIKVIGHVPNYKYEISMARDHDETVGEIDSASAMRRFDDAHDEVRESIKLVMAGATLGGKRVIIREEISGYWYCVCVSKETTSST